MGIRTPVSTNIAMTLGGLKQGVTPLDMAHAYETLASGGKRVTGTLGATEEGPVGIKEVEDPLAHRTIKNQTEKMKAVSRKLAETETSVLQTVVQSRHGDRARRRAASWPERPGRPRTTATPGSWATTSAGPWRCGSATPTR